MGRRVLQDVGRSLVHFNYQRPPRPSVLVTFAVQFIYDLPDGVELEVRIDFAQVLDSIICGDILLPERPEPLAYLVIADALLTQKVVTVEHLIDLVTDES